VASYARELAPRDGQSDPAVTWRGTGSDLVGLEYAPPFSYYAGSVTTRNNVEGEPLSYKHFNEAVKVASGGKATAYVFRSCYRLWLREAGVDEWRADRYFGHVVNQLKRRYAAHELTKFLEEDTKKLVAYLRKERKRPTGKSKAVERLDW